MSASLTPPTARLFRASAPLFFSTACLVVYGKRECEFMIGERELIEGLDLGSGLLVPIPRLAWGGNYLWEFDRELVSFVWLVGLGIEAVHTN